MFKYYNNRDELHSSYFNTIIIKPGLGFLKEINV